MTAQPSRRPDPAAPWAEQLRHLVRGGEDMTPRELEYWVLALTGTAKPVVKHRDLPLSAWIEYESGNSDATD